MMIVRFLAGIFALLLIFVISSFTKIDMMTLTSMSAFILVIDMLACRYISYVYLKATYVEMEKVQQEIDEREKRERKDSCTD